MMEIDDMNELDSRQGGPLPMKFFSTWEVRKVPANCVSRSCTLTITRLQILQSIEPGLQSVVLSVSMKTPHRSLRSNELEVPLNGIMNTPLNLTFTLEYPHFLKRGGNDLQIRLQRKKRYRYRTIRGYKTLARGEVNMGLVLQTSFQGVVKLFSEKNPDPLAVVDVSSLTSIPAVEMGLHTDPGSSDEEDEMVFSDERGSDSDSIENLDPETTENVPKISLKQPSSVLRLLRLRALRSHAQRQGLPIGLDEEGEGAVSMVSSISDSYDEEEETLEHEQATPRPRLRPFFGSDTLSLVSMPQPGEAEGMIAAKDELTIAQPRIRSHSASEALEPLNMPESALIKGRLWLIQESDVDLQAMLHEIEEPLLAIPSQCTSSSLLSLLNTLHNLWQKAVPFLLLVTGNCTLLSTILRAYVTGPIFSLWMYLWSDIEKTARASPLNSTLSLVTEQFTYSQESIICLLSSLDEEPLVSRPLPIAEAVLHLEPTPPDINPINCCIPFIFNAVIGSWEMDFESSRVPISSSPPTAPSNEHHELTVEYWSGKKDSQKSSVKVRSVMVTVISGPLLNITAIARKKGIRIRRLKDSTGESSIISVNASYMTCRSTKSELITAVVDGVEWPSLAQVRLSAQWNQTPTVMFPRATCHTPPNSTLPTQ